MMYQISIAYIPKRLLSRKNAFWRMNILFWKSIDEGYRCWIQNEHIPWKSTISTILFIGFYFLFSCIVCDCWKKTLKCPFTCQACREKIRAQFSGKSNAISSKFLLTLPTTKMYAQVSNNSILTPLNVTKHVTHISQSDFRRGFYAFPHNFSPCCMETHPIANEMLVWRIHASLQIRNKQKGASYAMICLFGQ